MNEALDAGMKSRLSRYPFTVSGITTAFPSPSRRRLRTIEPINVFRVVQVFGLMSIFRLSSLRTLVSPFAPDCIRCIVMLDTRSAILFTPARISGLSESFVYPADRMSVHPSVPPIKREPDRFCGSALAFRFFFRLLIQTIPSHYCFFPLRSAAACRR